MRCAKSEPSVIFLIVLICCRSGVGQNSTVDPSNSIATSLSELAELETSISTAWRNGDRESFDTNSRVALAKSIPKAVIEVASGVVKLAGYVTRSVPLFRILSPIFSILSVVVDVINLTVFREDSEFADLYKYLQNQFVQVNAMIEENYHAIQDVLSLLKCSQAYNEVRSRQIQIDAFYDRFVEMTHQAQTDRKSALKVFDTELPQYPSTKILVETNRLLQDKTLYTAIINDCAAGSITQYQEIMMKLHETFQKAILLDRVVKTRLYNLSKSDLDAERTYWKSRLDTVISNMIEAGRTLLMDGWYGHYVTDVNKQLSRSSVSSASYAASSLGFVLNQQYTYIRTAVLVVPGDASISVRDAVGADVKSASSDNFMCYRGNRASGDTVMVLCRNTIKYSGEQVQLDAAFANYSHGYFNDRLRVIDVLNDKNWKQVGEIMLGNKVSFFPLTVTINLKSADTRMIDWSKIMIGKVEYKYSSNNMQPVYVSQFNQSADFVFFESCTSTVSGERKFQALVVAKLVQSSTWNLLPPKPVTCRTNLCLGSCGMVMAAIATVWLAVY